jgi:hypothetical protein
VTTAEQEPWRIGSSPEEPEQVRLSRALEHLDGLLHRLAAERRFLVERRTGVHHDGREDVLEIRQRLAQLAVDERELAGLRVEAHRRLQAIGEGR